MIFDTWTDKDLDENIAAKTQNLALRRNDPGFRNSIESAINEIDMLNAEKQKREQSLLEKKLSKTGETSKSDLGERLDSVYSGLESNAAERVKRLFAPQRVRAIEEEAALGRLRSPVSLDRDSAISNVDQQEANALSDVIGTIMNQKASGTLDMERLRQGDVGLNQQAIQYLSSLGLQNNQFAETKKQNNLSNMYNQMALDQAERAGKMQAEAKKPGILDYINTAFGGLSALGGLAGGIGTAKKAWA